ncbi:MAG: sugar transferase [Chloroflexota bacterium]|nr:sugar transferase [Chloroflexota bacterium]
MIRRHGTILRLSLAAADGAAVIALFLVISELRFGDNWPRIWRSLFNEAWAPAVLLGVCWIIVLWSQGLYRLRQRWSFLTQAVAMLRAVIVMTLVTFAALFLFKLDDVSRAFLFMVLPSLAVASLVLRALIHGMLVALRRRGLNTRHVLVVGSGPTAVRFAQEMQGHPTLGLRVVGYINGTADSPVMAWPYLGSIDRLADVLHDEVVDEVAVCLDLADWQTVEEIIELCRTVGKIVRIPLAGGILAHGSAQVENLSGIPILSIVQGPDRQLALAVKRIVDLVASGAGLVVSIPLTLAVGLAILLEDGRPIFFRQERVGLHGRRFRVLKFRTMRHDAEQLLPELLPLNEVNGQAFKVTDDPRITRVGHFLRRTSLDELPQLWNVLRGEMSLVGPRPPLPAEVQEYDVWHRRRLSMKPGITGLWQVEARREADFDRWVEKDLEYIDGWSLWLDTKIALRTLPAMLKLEGR